MTGDAVTYQIHGPAERKFHGPTGHECPEWQNVLDAGWAKFGGDGIGYNVLDEDRDPSPLWGMKFCPFCGSSLLYFT